MPLEGLRIAQLELAEPDALAVSIQIDEQNAFQSIFVTTEAGPERLLPDGTG